MGLYKFSVAAAAASSDLVSKITRARSDGANIYIQSITDIGNLNLSINEKNITINYDIVGTTTNSLFNWFICDTVGYETIIILYNSGTSSESTFGMANYNRMYFNVNNKLVCNPKISETIASQFNVLRGKFDSYEANDREDDVIMLTKCVYNDGSNIETGETIIADNLYVSTNLRTASFKTIVKDENGDQFINIGGIFYLPYSEDIVYPSWSEKQWILPPGTVDLEWHPATISIPEDVRWWDTSNTDTWYLSTWGGLGVGGYTLKKNKKDFLLMLDSKHINSVLCLQKNFSAGVAVIYVVTKALNNRPFIKIDSNESGNYGSSFVDLYNDKRIVINNSDNKIIISKNPYLLHVYAIKRSGDNIYIQEKLYFKTVHSYWIDSDFVGEKNLECHGYYEGTDSIYGWQRGLIDNCEIKYFAQVNHDQSSEEIIKTSQLLMEKFNIN